MKKPVLFIGILKNTCFAVLSRHCKWIIKMFSQDLARQAGDRLALSHRERIRFRLAPQITLEILLILASERGSISLGALVEQIAAAEKSIRSHVRSLMASGLVEEQKLADDKRAKILRLTPRGIDELTAYLQEHTLIHELAASF
jgi:DNA-binding MarR family transcriptional regulator